MSLGRIGSRAVVVGLGVLASLALMAAPSWAAKGGNEANAALCEPGGYAGVLFNQQGETFKNAGACTKYGAKGGHLVGVDAVAGPVVGNGYTQTCSGFGLKPGSSAGCGVRRTGSSDIPFGEVEENGTFSLPIGGACTNILGEKVTNLLVLVKTAEGTEFLREFPPPSGC
jgi:hypothetical protein